MKRVQTNFIGTLKENWFIIVFIGAIIAGWVRIEAKVNSHEEQITASARAIAVLQTGQTDLARDIASINVKLDFLVKQYDK